jgi:hypothetical protein
MNARQLSIIAAIQAGAVTIGTLITAFRLKTLGYSDTASSMWIEFNPRSLWVRDYGMVLMAIPVIWSIYVFWDARREDHERSRIPFPLGLVLLFGLFLLYFDTILNSHVRKILWVR